VRFALVLLAFSATAQAAVTSPSPDAGHASAYLKSLPAAQRPVFDAAQTIALASLPLSCIDHPQALQDRPQIYLWVYDDKAHPTEAYMRNRAFYGCYDWHSAVNSTWTMLALLKQNPKMFLGPVIRQRLTEHLGKDNIAGEVKFFDYEDPDDGEWKGFERPYGFTWLLKLYGTAGEIIRRQVRVLPEQPAVSGARGRAPEHRAHHEFRSRLRGCSR
jgi:Protein of unknown function (DUF2891)